MVFYFILGCDSEENLTFLEKYDGSVWSHPSDDGETTPLAERLGFYNSTSIFLVMKDVSDYWCETIREGHNANYNETIIIEENTSERLKIKISYSNGDYDEIIFIVNDNNKLDVIVKEIYVDDDNDRDDYTYTLLPDESNLNC